MFYIVNNVILITPIEVDVVSNGSSSDNGAGRQRCGMIEFIQLGDDRARLDV